MEGYDLYFQSGVYERRYPAPNRATLRLVEELIARHGDHVLDFGCGSGRYAVPLALQHPLRLLAYDPCEVGLSLLKQRAHGTVAEQRIVTISGSLDELAARAAVEGKIDVAIMLFGVLGHIRYRIERLRHLRAVRELLNPDGILVVSVPNALRRFHREQAAPWHGDGVREPGDILYERTLDDRLIELFYHLYRAGELEQELVDAGFEPRSTRSESVLPEWLISRRPAAAAIDEALRAVTPTGLAYGFLTIAARDRG